MKKFTERFWPLAGALGIAAAAGLYRCSYNLFNKQENNHFQERDNLESYVEKSEKKISAPARYNNLKVKKERDKIDQRKTPKHRHEPSKFPEKKLYWANPFSRYESPPKNHHLEEKVEEGMERPWYDLSSEKRGLLKTEEVARYFYAALEADDYKVAESYIENAHKSIGLSAEEDKERLKKELAHVIISSYNNFLEEVIENCDKDYDSVFRKVMWMNFFIAKNEEALPILDPYTERYLNLYALQQKGTEALEAIEYCVEKKKP